MLSHSQSFVCPGAAPGSLEEGGWPYGCSLELAEGLRGCLPSWRSLTAAHLCSSPNLHVAQPVCEVCVHV